MSNSDDQLIDVKPFSLKKITTAGGFYRIPRYQRQYSWNKSQVTKLLGDIYVYYRSCLDSEGAAKYQKFIGTLILVNTGNALSRIIYDVIDGQQRLTTLQIILYAIAVKRIALLKDYIALNQDTDNNSLAPQVVSELFSAAEKTVAGKLYHISEQKYYPLLFREDVEELSDYCSAQNGKVNSVSSTSPISYKSDTAVAFYGLARFFAAANVQITREGQLQAWRNQKIDSKITANFDGSYKQSYDIITDFLDALCEGMGDNSISGGKGKGYKFLSEYGKVEEEDIPPEEPFDLKRFNAFFQKLFFEKQGYDSVFEVLESIRGGQLPNWSIPLIQSIRLHAFYCFLDSFVNYVQIECKSDEALDIFQTVNTTGKPLTCIETFLPEVHRLAATEGLSDFSEPIADAYDGLSLQDLLFKVNMLSGKISNLKRGDGNSEIVTMFALVYSGTKLGKKESEQRRYLIQHLQQAIKSAPDNEAKTVAIYRYVLMLYLMQRWWLFAQHQDKPEAFSDDDKILAHLPVIKCSTEELQNNLEFCCAVLQSTQQRLATAVAGRFYCDWELGHRTPELADKLAAALKSLVAFSALWLSGSAQTDGIDYVYRSVLSPRVSNDRSNVLDFNYCSNNPLDLSQLQKFLFGEYCKNKNEAGTVQGWLDNLTKNPTAVRKNMTRFLHMVYVENSEKDDASAIGVRMKVHAKHAASDSMLRLQKWNAAQQLELEHIVPQTTKGEWLVAIDGCSEQDKKIRLNQLGNTTFLPKVPNILVGNRNWSFKKAYYTALSLNRSGEDIYNELKRNEKQLAIGSKELESVWKNRSLLDKFCETQFTAGFKGLEKWTPNTIQQRTAAMADIIWPELCHWLGAESEPAEAMKAENQPEASEAAEGVSDLPQEALPDAGAVAAVEEDSASQEAEAVMDASPLDALEAFRGKVEAVVGFAAEQSGGKWIWTIDGGEVVLELNNQSFEASLTGKRGKFRVRGGLCHKTKDGRYAWTIPAEGDNAALMDDFMHNLKRWMTR